MSKINRILHLILLLFSFTFLNAQNRIFEKIQNLKKEGVNFEVVNDILVKSEQSKEILNEFKNPSKVDFMSYNDNLLNKLSDYISIEVLLDNKVEVIELVAVDQSFYDYIVTTNEDRVLSANKDIKHYRGIIKEDENSLVAISFSKNFIGAIISNKNGNYNLSSLEKGSQVVVFNENNLINTLDFECGTIDQPFTSSEINNLNLHSQNNLNPSNKCVRFYYEVEYDVFQNKGSVVNVENYLSTIFNQVSLLYENENINTSISEIKIWTVEDPFTGTSTGSLLSQFQNYTTSINGDLGQLLTFRSIGGGQAAGFSGLCNSNVSQKLSVSKLYSNHSVSNIYTWNTQVITHEFGHTFGSRHTHACVWNGNNTAIDSCAGGTEGGCSLPGVPSGGGTIMSYCHLQSVGINFSNGFGLQPGDLIRAKVLQASCLGDCNLPCEENLNITQQVLQNSIDIRKASNTILASNLIENTGFAQYTAGNVIVLKPGFHSKLGSNSHFYNADCDTQEMFSASEKVLTRVDVKSEKLDVSLYPNPTSGLITIESNQEIIFWELTDEIGKVNKSGKIDNLKVVELDFSNLNYGIYNIKIHLSNGEFSYKKMIKR